MNLSKLITKLMANAIPTASACLIVGKANARRYWSVVYDGKRRNAHQAAWQFSRGAIPKGMCVCHHCDNPRCINLDHLFLGTMSDNLADRDRKGRNGTMGENARTAKLTREDVLAIRSRMSDNAEDTAREFDVSPQTILRVINRETWKHL